MTTLVTGATGHLGRLAIESLLAHGVAPGQIVGTGRSIERAADLADRGVRIVAADYDDGSSLDAALEGVDTLVLVSGSEVGRRVPQHEAVIAAAVRAGAARIVYTSILDAESTPLVLAPEHAATERAIRDSGLPFTILRNGWYLENYFSTVQQALSTGTIVTSAGQGRVASALRSEYAEAIAVVATTEEHEWAIYELSGDTAWSFDEFAAALAEASGTTVAVEHVTAEQHAAALTAAGLDEGTAGFVVALDGSIRDGLLASTTGDLARLLGRPTATLEQSVRSLLP
jgi:NAD(P)H dehydrogenase (quinone)